jgi:hypothetical protein
LYPVHRVEPLNDLLLVIHRAAPCDVEACKVA